MQQATFFGRGSRHGLLMLIGWLAAVLTVLAPQGAARSAPAQQAPTSVPVWYDSFNNIIYVGQNYNPADPAQAPYVGYPSHPQAPKSPITIPQVAAALNNPQLLQNQGGGAWLLKADMVISQTARLEATAASISWLRLDSTPGAKFPALTHITARGGNMLIQDIKVTSWDGNNVDTNYFDGRSYLLAESGGRMDIIRSDVSYLGWSAGEPSGLAWRLRAGYGGDDPVTAENIKRGSTGSILNSNIHHNYFGQYSFEAYGLRVLNNEFHDNVFYGFDPHDYSTGFEVAYNKVYNNGKHGIIFSRGCTLNVIHHNEVYGNAEHGIMLDRGSNVNQISNNIVYNNSDGVAIFQSEKNLIQNNNLHDNNVGVRINATFDSTDVFDGLSTENTVLNNTVQNNIQYGIYFYERADKNTIQNNVVSGNAGAGIYIKTGGNVVKANAINGNGDGVSIVGTTAPTPGGIAPSYDPGHKNVIQANTIENNDDNGIQLQGAVDTLIGLKELVPNAADANLIRTNGTHGISIDATSQKNDVFGNTIHGNGSDGVIVKGPASGSPVDSRNRITRNSITANGRRGISVDATANRGIQPPTITSAPGASVVGGSAAPNARVEVYRDANGQGKVFKGAATANASGAWSFTLPVGDNVQEGGLTALQIDQYGNTSQFFGMVSGGGVAVYEIGAGKNGDLTIFISGPGAAVTLPEIQAAVQTISPTKQLLVNQGNGVWQANASLFLNHGVTLTLNSPTVKWLKLRSQVDNITLSSASAEDHYNYRSFVTLRTYGGAILIDGVKITSWNPSANTYDTDTTNGRSYILAKYDARLHIKNADLSYLGSADGESYGVSWRDINDSEAPTVLRTRVTGEVVNSNFSYNYYGIYTFQASNMVFRGNKFHNNIGYGFDPHDFSNHFTIEDNESFANGNHGFIISRGCNNFVFRRNKSYDNHYTIGTDARAAHGFMLDPGSPNSIFPQAPSHDNLLENNQAWGNDGYGLRVVNSDANTIKNNTFTGNLQGITLEQGSTDNVVQGNQVAASQVYGIYLIGGSDHNTLSGNTITHSGKHGIYIKTSNNTITGNTVSSNGTVVGGVPSGSGIATLKESDLAAAAADLQPRGLRVSAAASDPELLAPQVQASSVVGNLIANNIVSSNADEGIELKSAGGTQVESNVITGNGSSGVYLASGAHDTTIALNTISRNRGYGIKANGLDVVDNQWTKNVIFDNGAGGITITSGANNGIPAPKVVQKGRDVTITTQPGTMVEIYSDDGGQGRFFEARLTATTGTITLTRAWKGTIVNATATIADSNTSGFAFNHAAQLAASTIYLPLIKR